MPGSFDTHLKRGHVVTFGLLVFFSLIEWAIAASLIQDFSSEFPRSNSVRDKVCFLLFVGLWTFVFSFVYIFGFLKATTSFAFSIASHAVWIFITWVFWLAGAAAITAALGTNWNRGHEDTLYALEAFAWINWIIITIMLFVVLFTGWRSARGGNGFGGAMVDV
ncbi:hypothetical protein JCM11251_002743 [Rhodosporidiobolus azoricus]